MKVSLLTGGVDKHYASGLLLSLIQKGIKVNFIGSDELQDERIIGQENVNFYNLYGSRKPKTPIKEKVFRVIKFYLKLVKYAVYTETKLFHILWLNKFLFLDRTFLNIFYKICGKKIVFTAHNIDQKERDGKNTLINRMSLKFLYLIVDHIFVHTEKMKLQLIDSFHVRGDKITVIPYGINNMVPDTKMSKNQARNELSLKVNEKVLLSFGAIAPYKGLEYLILSLVDLTKKYINIKLIIAGSIKNKNCVSYWEGIQKIIKEHKLEKHIIENIQFIQDEMIEVYFKAADVLIIPYKNIFQSGVIFLSYNFGLPVIVTDVGSFKETIVEGKTGFICRPEDEKDLARTIEKYFDSDLYKNIEETRNNIIQYSNEKSSWEKVGEITLTVYKSLQ
jgi:glycosyltransferase involved in cell wall biosynthesis